jgi:hypothetical protein
MPRRRTWPLVVGDGRYVLVRGGLKFRAAGSAAYHVER